MPQSRLGLETERLGLGLGLDTEDLGLSLGFVTKCLHLVGKYFSIRYIKLCLNMPLRFSLSSRLPPLLFRTTSLLGMMWMWDVGCGLGLDALVSRPSGGAVVPRLGFVSELVCLGLVFISSSEGLDLGLVLA